MRHHSRTVPEFRDGSRSCSYAAQRYGRTVSAQPENVMILIIYPMRMKTMLSESRRDVEAICPAMPMAVDRAAAFHPPNAFRAAVVPMRSTCSANRGVKQQAAGSVPRSAPVFARDAICGEEAPVPTGARGRTTRKRTQTTGGHGAQKRRRYLSDVQTDVPAALARPNIC